MGTQRPILSSLATSSLVLASLPALISLGLGLIFTACGGAPPAPAAHRSTEASASFRTQRVSFRTQRAPAQGRESASIGAAANPGASPCSRQSPGTGATPIPVVPQSSTVAVAQQNGQTIAYAADEDGRAIHTFAIDTRAPLAVTPLDGSPSHLLVLADGRVAIALRDANRVAVYEPGAGATEPLTMLCSAPVPAEPLALAAMAAGDHLLVTSGWGHALTALRTSDLGADFTINLAREPRAVILDDVGRRAFVSHAIGGSVSVVDLAAPERRVSSIDLRVRRRTEREGSQGYAMARGTIAPSSDGGPGSGRIFVPMVSVDPGAGEHSTASYGPANGLPVAPMVSVLDEKAEKPLSTELALDFGEAQPLSIVGGAKGACTLPRAAVTSDSSTLFISCLGIDALLELDARVRDPIHVERRRFTVPAGPTGIALDDPHRRAMVWSQFAHELTIIDLMGRPDANAVTSIRPSATLTGWPSPVIARGRILFHESDDARISGDGRACASCHPEGREDGLSWQTPNGKHQTIMLAGRVMDAGPYGWHAAGRTLKSHVAQTFKRLGGRGIFSDADRADFDALLAYLGSMRGPSIAGAKGAPEADLVTRGRALFESHAQGCAGCHPGGDTDRSRYDVKSGGFRGEMFDTPSLRFVGGTAPYFHDGRYPTLQALLEKSDGKMGHTAGLSSADIQALVAYLETR